MHLSQDPIELVCQANLDAMLELSAERDLRFCLFLGLSPGYWLRVQAAYDTEVA